MLVAGDRDWGFPVEGVRAVYERALPFHRASGPAYGLQILVFDGEHSFPEEARQQMYEFVDRALKG